jgi:hypothetical protein
VVELRVDLVVDERRAQRAGRAAAADRRHDPPEVPVAHFLRRHDRVVVQRNDVVVGELRAEEEEQLVLDDRPADRAAQLIAVQAVVAAQAAVFLPFEVADGVELVIAEEAEAVAVKRVGPGLVTALTVAPVDMPKRASRAPVSTLNSCSASGNGMALPCCSAGRC